MTGPELLRRPRRWLIEWLKQSARPAFNRYLARYSEVGDPVVFPPGVFPWAAQLETDWRAIRDEALAVLELRQWVPAFQEVSPDQYRISQGDAWKTFWLRGFGHRSDAFCDFCPRTAALVDGIPDVENAFFSILAPGMHIIAHRGVFKGLVNYHLGLVVPRERERCHMRVGEERFHWVEGESRIFDDTNEHEVWNDTDEDRVVLMLQFLRPLRPPARQLRDLFLQVLKRTPYVTVALENQERFEQRFQAALDARSAPEAPALGAR